MSQRQSSNPLLSFPAHTSQLAVIRGVVSKALGCASWLTPAGVDAIVLAVDEACTNVIEHGYQSDASKNVMLEVVVGADEVRVVILDSAPSFDPRSRVAPDLDKRIQAGKRGGLGVHIMRSSVDDVRYEPSASQTGLNQLTLIKRRM